MPTDTIKTVLRFTPETREQLGWLAEDDAERNDALLKPNLTYTLRRIINAEFERRKKNQKNPK